MNAVVRPVVYIAIGTALVLLALRLGRHAIRSAKRSTPGTSAVGWALLFLTSGRMPPPPPASQIEVDLAGKKDREASRDIGES